mmetsp:Transcript_29465/g.50891  ORF Transcript_29465/g.50891 Transcript_29465/m.50891 type:complete len:285 (+) Transcript_29465:174-1028(+)
MDLGLMITGSGKNFTTVASRSPLPSRQVHQQQKVQHRRKDALPRIQQNNRSTKPKALLREKRVGNQATSKSRRQKDAKPLPFGIPKKEKKKVVGKGSVLAAVRPAEMSLASAEYPPTNKQEPIFADAHVTVKYSHYNKKFFAPNGKLPWASIDEEYCISFVFKGDFKVTLVDDVLGTAAGALENGRGKLSKDSDGCFHGVEDTHRYLLSVDEDPNFVTESKPISFAKTKQDVVLQSMRGNQPSKRIDEMTAQLKNLTAGQRANQTDEYKQLIEERDIEDCLYNY